MKTVSDEQWEKWLDLAHDERDAMIETLQAIADGSTQSPQVAAKGVLAKLYPEGAGRPYVD